jgi:hypothetical protein
MILGEEKLIQSCECKQQADLLWILRPLNSSPERKCIAIKDITLLQDLSVNSFASKIFKSNEKSFFYSREDVLDNPMAISKYL